MAELELNPGSLSAVYELNHRNWADSHVNISGRFIWLWFACWTKGKRGQKTTAMTQATMDPLGSWAGRVYCHLLWTAEGSRELWSNSWASRADFQPGTSDAEGNLPQIINPCSGKAREMLTEFKLKMGGSIKEKQRREKKRTEGKIKRIRKIIFKQKIM